ncbi:MAG TPA: hypothetical protein PK735_09780, partial [Flavobacteriales bacterium]|nr:hypothetical protein [Flavobacteriales bacterium]
RSITVHGFRHGIRKDLLEQDTDLHYIQALQGQSAKKTTMIALLSLLKHTRMFAPKPLARR